MIPNYDTIVPLIERNGQLRKTKPADGNAAYVWRMAAFSLSDNPRHHAMPVTADFGVVVPDGWCPSAPEGWLDAQCARTLERPEDTHYVLTQAKTVREYHQQFWVKYARRREFIRTVLDPIVERYVKRVPVTQQPGTMRWARAFGRI